MKLSLFVDIYNRKLVKSATSDFPVDLPTLFREDWIDLEITLVEPSGTITSPQTVVDVSSISIKAAIGNPDSDPEAFQNTFTKDTANNKYTGTLNINTTEMEQAFTAASGNTIDRYFEIEVEGPSNHFHTVLQKSITLHKDVIVNATVAPTDVTSGSAFATSFAATATDSTTIEWTKSGDSNYAHLKGTSGLSALTASKYVKVKSDASGFELADATGAASAMDDLTDVDTSTAAPSTGDHIKWDGTNWVPTSDPPTHSHTYALDDLSNVTAGSPSSGQVLAWNGSAWVPDTNTAPNLWATVTGDSGTTTADSTTDSLKVAGGEGMTTSVAGDVVTVDGEDATDTNKGIAKFKSTDFTVTNGEVALDAVSIANGGTGQASAESAFDALAPTTTAGDLIQMNAAGTDNERLAIGSAGQVLTVNSGGTQAEWAAASGGGGSASDSFKTISVSGQSDVVADSSTDTLTLVAGSNVTLTTDASADSVTIAASGGSSASDSFKTIAVSGQNDVVADSSTDTLTLVAGSNITLTTDDSTDTITIASSGGGGGSSEVSFFAHRNGSAQSIPSSTVTQIQFSNTDFDNGSGWQSGYYNFQAPSDGRYLLSALATFDDLDTGSQCSIFIYKNGSSETVAETTVTHAGLTDPSLDCQVLVDATSGDYFSARVWHDSSSSVDVFGTKTKTKFEGFKIN